MTAREQMIEAMVRAMGRTDPNKILAENALDALSEGLVWDWLVETGYVKQVGWRGPYGIIPGGMDNEPAEHWQPVYQREDFSHKFGVQRDYPGMSGLPVEES